MSTPLTELPCGCLAKVEALPSDRALRSKLCALGMYPGSEVTVQDGYNNKDGVKIRVKDSLLVLNTIVASGVYCKRMDSTVEHFSGLNFQ